MKQKRRITGRKLNSTYKVGALQARYREDGVWYHPLHEFPGALFDGRGYVLFRTQSEYETCRRVKRGPHPNHIHVDEGIASIPGYVRLDPPRGRIARCGAGALALKPHGSSRTRPQCPEA